MKRVVLDASVALAWFIDNPIPGFSSHVKREMLGGVRCVVPALWHLEIANGLVSAERRGIVVSQDADLALAEVHSLSRSAIETDEDLVSTVEIAQIARVSGLTSYDAVYLRLASKEKIEIATLDLQLRQAAVKFGVALFH